MANEHDRVPKVELLLLQSKITIEFVGKGVIHMTSNLTNIESHMEELIINTINKALLSSKQMLGLNEWMSIKEGAKYAGVSYNTFKKFRSKGLKISEIDGVMRVSRKEIDRFLESHNI